MKIKTAKLYCKDLCTIEDMAFELFAMHYGIGSGMKQIKNLTGKMS